MSRTSLSVVSDSVTARAPSKVNLHLGVGPRREDGYHDLVTVFRWGWSVLHERVGLHTARMLVEILSRLKSDNGGLYGHLAELRDGLRRQLDEGTPWRERDNLDALAALDLPTWSVLVGLVDQCPVVPGRPSGLEFIAENRQVEWVHRFLRSLPERWCADGGR